MKALKILVCLLFGFAVFAGMLLGVLAWIGYFNPPIVVRYFLVLPYLTLSIFAGRAMWLQSLKELDIEIDEKQ